MVDVQVRTFQCGQCGAGLVFRPGVHALTCGRCDFEQPLPITVDPQFKGTPLHAAPSVAASALLPAESVRCEGCGAVLSAGHRAARCALCDSPVVVESADPRIIAPHALLPFHLDRAAAQQQIERWAKKLWFAPSGLVARMRTDVLAGVYVPYWIFACETTTSYSGERGTAYYETESYTDAEGQVRTREVRRVRWEPWSGVVHRPFDHRLVCGSTSLSPQIVAALAPWDLPFLQRFDPRLLSGFVCERSSLTAGEAFARLRPQLDSDLRTDVRLDIGGDEQRIRSTSTTIAQESFRFVLLPVWLGACRFEGSVWQLAVNARTGEVISSTRPFSRGKVLALAAVVLLALLWLAALALLAAVEDTDEAPRSAWYCPQGLPIGGKPEMFCLANCEGWDFTELYPAWRTPGDPDSVPPGWCEAKAKKYCHSYDLDLEYSCWGKREF